MLFDAIIIYAFAVTESHSLMLDWCTSPYFSSPNAKSDKRSAMRMCVYVIMLVNQQSAIITTSMLNMVDEP